MNLERFKNPWFWIGLIGVVFTAMGVNPESVTSWEIFLSDFRKLVDNPFMLGSVLTAVLGVFTDPTTHGMGDSKEKIIAPVEDKIQNK